MMILRICYSKYRRASPNFSLICPNLNKFSIVFFIGVNTVCIVRKEDAFEDLKNTGATELIATS